MRRRKTSFPTHDNPFFRPPTFVTVKGVDYPIRWQFDTAFLFMEYVDASQDTDEVFLDTVLSLWYPKIPPDRDAALEEAIRFYCAGTLPEEGYYSPAVRPIPTREELYLNFLKYYGIDLNRQRLHWWTVRRLLEELKERRQACNEMRFRPSPKGNFYG